MRIPSRIALGYRLNGERDNPGMKFHAWVEIREGDRWVSMDSTIDQSTLLDRIKVLESDFNGPNPMSDVLSVFKLIANLELRVAPL